MAYAMKSSKPGVEESHEQINKIQITLSSKNVKNLEKGVSNCYVFKSQLQEYAQKVGYPTPVYETIKEGPSHEPHFRSTVIVNNVRYDSLPGFFNRKAAEQSAAEVALLELSKSSEVKECISVPVHETGLCKNLLQEYAQKMNYAIPMYNCERDNTTGGRVAYFSCTVEIGGMRYIGGAAKTKKEAEIKAARTALLAIRSTSSESSDGYSQLTVIPGKKREIESVKNSEETPRVLKPKKARFKKRKMAKLKRRGDAIVSNMIGLVSTDVQVGIESVINPSAVDEGMESPAKAKDALNVDPSGSVVEGMESPAKVKEEALNVDLSGSVAEGMESPSKVKEEALNVDPSGSVVEGMEPPVKAKVEALNVNPSRVEVSVVEVQL